MKKIPKIILTIALIALLTGAASADNFKYPLGTIFKGSDNTVYVVTNYAGNSYEISSIQGTQYIDAATVNSWQPFAQPSPLFESIKSLAIINGVITPLVFGDVTGNDAIDVGDTLYEAQYIAGSRVFNDGQIKAADVTGDGKIDNADTTALSNYVTGKYNLCPRCGQPITTSTPTQGRYIAVYVQNSATHAGIQASVTIDGMGITQISQSGGATIYLSDGAHSYTANYPGYSTATGSFTSSSTATTQYIYLTATTTTAPAPTTTIAAPAPTAPITTGIPAPTVVPPAISKLFSLLWGSVKGIFGLSISGGQTVSIELNKPYTTSLSLAFTPPDSDYSDGSYQTVFAEWLIADANQNIKYESGWQQLTSSPYAATPTFTPQTAGSYYLIGVVVKQQYTYSNGWTMTENVETKEVQQLVAKQTISPPSPNPPAAGDFLSGLFAWLRSLFPF